MNAICASLGTIINEMAAKMLETMKRELLNILTISIGIEMIIMRLTRV